MRGGFEEDADGMECNRTGDCQYVTDTCSGLLCSPYHSFILLLTNVLRDFAVHRS